LNTSKEDVPRARSCLIWSDSELVEIYVCHNLSYFLDSVTYHLLPINIIYTRDINPIRIGAQAILFFKARDYYFFCSYPTVLYIYILLHKHLHKYLVPQSFRHTRYKILKRAHPTLVGELCDPPRKYHFTSHNLFSIEVAFLRPRPLLPQSGSNSSYSKIALSTLSSMLNTLMLLY